MAIKTEKMWGVVALELSTGKRRIAFLPSQGGKQKLIFSTKEAAESVLGAHPIHPGITATVEEVVIAFDGGPDYQEEQPQEGQLSTP